MRTIHVSLALLLFAGVAQAQNDIDDYGAMCRELISDITPFTCKDGVLIPSTTINGKCDKPNWLKGTCVPNSRLVVAQTSRPDTHAVFICRKYRDVAGETYHDIAGVHYNARTGATCWYQTPPSQDRNGDQLIVPTRSGLSVSERNALRSFWEAPSTTQGHQCHTCHENDPFMVSPWLQQVSYPSVIHSNSTNKPSGVPSGQSLPYVTATFGNAFRGWEKYRTNLNNACTSCHQFGATGMTSQAFIQWAGGRDGNISFPHNANPFDWMGVTNNLAAYNEVLSCISQDPASAPASCGFHRTSIELATAADEIFWDSGQLHVRWRVQNKSPFMAKTVAVDAKATTAAGQTVSIGVPSVDLPAHHHTQLLVTLPPSITSGSATLTLDPPSGRLSQGEFIEDDETDNSSTVALPGLPDLRATSLTLQAFHDLVTATCTVRNDGAQRVQSNAVRVSFSSNGQALRAQTLPVSIPANGSRTIRASRQIPGSGSHSRFVTVTCTVDPDNVQPETSENNNSTTGWITLGPSTPLQPPTPDDRVRELAQRFTRGALRVLNPFCFRVMVDPDNNPCGPLRYLPEIPESPGPLPPLPILDAWRTAVLESEAVGITPPAIDAALAALDAAESGEVEDLEDVVGLLLEVALRRLEVHAVPVDVGPEGGVGEALPGWFVEAEPVEGGTIGLRPFVLGIERDGSSELGVLIESSGERGPMVLTVEAELVAPGEWHGWDGEEWRPLDAEPVDTLVRIHVPPEVAAIAPHGDFEP